MGWKMDASHAISADGAQCDRCGVVAREFSATLRCLYADGYTEAPVPPPVLPTKLEGLRRDLELQADYDALQATHEQLQAENEEAVSEIAVLHNTCEKYEHELLRNRKRQTALLALVTRWKSMPTPVSPYQIDLCAAELLAVLEPRSDD